MENCAQVIRAYLAVLGVCLALVVSGYFFRDYLHKTLLAIEDQVGAKSVGINDS